MRYTPSMAAILMGTCSWTDDGLIKAGTFYPAGATSAEQRLRFYATQFPIVEVDSTYYSLPSVRNSVLWNDRTPDEFTFDVKAFRLFTGHPTELKVLPKDAATALEPIAAGKRNVYLKDVPQEIRDDLWGRFTGALEPLRASGKLGVIVYQLPPWVMPSREAEEMIEEADRHLEGYEVAVEFRNALWFSERSHDRTLAFLEDHHLSFVAVDEPQGFKSSVPPVVAVTGPVAVVRFHGRNAKRWEARNATAAERFDWYYTDAEFQEWAPRIQEMAQDAREVHLLMNTNNADQGPVNAHKLADVMHQYELL